MAQVKLLKIASDGVPLEFSASADDITLNSFTVNGSSALWSSTSLDMKNTPVIGVSALNFQDPSTSVINQTVGNVIVDNLMAKERENTMTTAGGVVFPVITNVAGQVDSFRLPALAGAPTATPTNGGEGHMVWNSSSDALYIWNGFSWENMNSDSGTYNAATTIAAQDVLYISASGSVSPALGDATSSSFAIGLAAASAAASGSVVVQDTGDMGGFSGLTPGARYYLSAATAGKITSSIPVGVGNTICMVGYSRSPSELHIQIQQMGRRAS